MKANSMRTGPTTPQANNWRNWLPILTTYAYIAMVVLAALWFFRWREQHLPWWTDIPVGLVAIALIGPAQHRLLIVGHEAALGVLFRNRWLNELVGDWLIHFPFSSATHHARLQVLAHYEHPNDPEKDAELVIARRAGFWPLQWSRLLRLSAIIRWISLRTNYNFERNPNNPYYDPDRPPSKLALHIGTVYVLLTFAILLALYFFRRQIGDEFIEAVLTFVLPALWLIAFAVFWILPESKYHRGRLEGVYSPKTMTLMRLTFVSLVNAGLGWITFVTERSAVLNYFALWIAPMFTTTAVLYLIRQWRQHGNLPAGEVAWDRRPGLLGRFLLFPLNQHRQKAKHASPGTAWYNLPKASGDPRR
jgi:fatty acid desaturase